MRRLVPWVALAAVMLSGCAHQAPPLSDHAIPTAEQSTAKASTHLSTPAQSSARPNRSPELWKPQGNPRSVRVLRGRKLVLEARLTPIGFSEELNPPADSAAWYREDPFPKPGGSGTALVVGHVSHRGEHGVFYRLNKVRPGDEVVVDYASNHKVRFKVTRISHPKKGFDLSKDVLVKTERLPKLRLMTCDSSSDFENGHYKGNILIMADERLS